jgi:hypothetical protein
VERVPVGPCRPRVLVVADVSDVPRVRQQQRWRQLLQWRWRWLVQQWRVVQSVVVDVVVLDANASVPCSYCFCCSGPVKLERLPEIARRPRTDQRSDVGWVPGVQEQQQQPVIWLCPGLDGASSVRYCQVLRHLVLFDVAVE